MKLIPVVEFEPATYQKHKHISPAGTIDENRDEWAAYWKASLADSGIEGLEPYAPGSWLVRVEAIHQPIVIEQLLKRHLAHVESTPDATTVDYVQALSGGYVFETDETIIYPQCCGDLGDIHEWKKAVSFSNEGEEMLWIGHPWLMMKSIDDTSIQIRETDEYDELAMLEPITLQRTLLQTAIDVAEAELAHFHQRIAPVVRELVPHEHEIVLDVLVYGNR